ncbi:MAG: hypothetical protein JWR05_2550 [Mucilaginibacter sp.]|nr:hypothetical protein [Mucilaginibacter sp.]
MISVVLASRNDNLLNNVTTSIKDTIGVNHEIIVVQDILGNKGICKVYNEGACKAIYGYLCFVHEDVIFHTNNWGEHLVNHLNNKAVSLVGVLGSIIKTKTPSGVYIPINKFNRINQLQSRKDLAIDKYYENPLNELYSEVKLLDGMFLATTKSNHIKYQFDEKLLTGFHAYDVDYSLGQSKNGKIIVVYDILIEHLSYGGNTTHWINEQLKITYKWGSQLPTHIYLETDEVKEAEIKNIETFLIALIFNNYKKALQLKYLFKLIWLRPFSFKNLYFIRKFLIFGHLERLIKKIIN